MSWLVVHFEPLLRKGKFMFLAYDEGLEHGPKAFDERTADPQFILDIALEGEYTGVILHAGIAEKYYKGSYKDVPLIIKLNGKTSLTDIDPIGRQICSVRQAVKLGASAVGYTIYDGSKAEPTIFKEFGKIVEEAHEHNLPVIAWVYPKHQGVGDNSYGARIALELGADMVKVKHDGDLQELMWAKRCAGRTKLLVSSKEYKPAEHFLTEAYNTIVAADADGLVVGRNVWKHSKPFSMSKALGEIVYRRKRPNQVMHLLK